ncbi:unnamed protein product, partial [Rotaria sp. Silwood2]
IRLALQNNEQKPSFQPQEAQQINHKLEQYQQNDQVQRFLIPIRDSPPSLPNNSVENISSTVERDRINHFGRYESSDEVDIEAMIRTSRFYSAKGFNQSEYSRKETHIAFNSNGALFFNLHYFEQVFTGDLKSYFHNTSSSISIVRTIVNFYSMATCHELSHNIDSHHDFNFINRLEKVSVRFMDAKDAFLSKFSFQ